MCYLRAAIGRVVQCHYRPGVHGALRLDLSATNPSMTSPFAKLLSRPLESALAAAQYLIVGAQQTLQALAGTEGQNRGGVPLAGPAETDGAVADFVNRAARIVRYMPGDTGELPAAAMRMAAAARQSFGYLDLTDPKNLLFPAQLALAVSRLATQSAQRGLAIYEVLGPDRVTVLFRDFFEMFTEFQVFVGLEYHDLIRRSRERIARAPDDYRTRLDLGKTLIKCGLYDQAEQELLMVTSGSPLYAEATHEVAVALFRAGRLERSARAAVLALSVNPQNLRTKSWLWMTAKKLGAWPDFVPAKDRMEVVAGYATPTLQFEDIAARIGLDKTSAGRGIAVFDYDNDGYLDILIAAAHGGCNLYHNNGDGTFTDVSISSGLDTCVNGFAVTVGDYNNDGFADVFVTRLGFYGGEGQLFRNNGNGTFTDVTKAAGVNVWGPAFTACWVDYDRDGRLDLFIANNLGGLFEQKTPNRLFHNNGDGTFTDVAAQAGLDTPWPTIGAAWGDYDDDGFPDLFVSNSMGRSQLFHNNGNGTFTDVSAAAGVDEPSFGSPAFWWDFDNDGWLDIAQFSWSDHEDVIHTMEHGEGPADGNPMRVYRNNRDGTFRLVSQEIGLNGCWGTMSGNAGDFNNDGRLDLVLGNGSPKMDRLEPLVVMENQGGTFRNVTFAAGFPFLGKSHGVNMADLFGDGRLSILVGAGGAYPGDLLTMNVYCPTEVPGNYLNVRLKGVTSNRSAIGARVTLDAPELAPQMREVSGGSNFGCLPFEQHFGLGTAAGVNSIAIRWPGGLRQTVTDLPINRTIEITEGLARWRDVYAEAAGENGSAG